MSIPKLFEDLAVIQKLNDLPNATDGLSAEELKKRFDYAALVIQAFLNNKLVPSLTADNIPFTGNTEIPAVNVQDAIKNVQGQIKDAATGAIPNGAVTQEKLAESLLERVYGGRPWVSVNTPEESNNVSAGFPVGQIWLRPKFSVNNVAGDSWAGTGCAVSVADGEITLTGDGTIATVYAEQSLANIGLEGDRVFILFDVLEQDSEITGVSVEINDDGEYWAYGAAILEGYLLSGGSLKIRIGAHWPAASLATGILKLGSFAVVNVDRIMRQTTDAEEMADWGSYLYNLLPLSVHVSPAEAFMQMTDGQWWAMGFETLDTDRGGTGIYEYAAGDMLYADEDGKLQKLEGGEDNAFLRYQGGRPVWQPEETTVAETGIVRYMTGSYEGTGAERTIELPISPKLLYLFNKEGPYTAYLAVGLSDQPVTLADGAIVAERYSVTNDDSTTTTKLQYVALEGNKLKFYADEDGVGSYMNKYTAAGTKPGDTAHAYEYGWVAIY